MPARRRSGVSRAEKRIPQTSPPRPPGTPDEVEITWQAPPPVRLEDSDFGIPVKLPPEPVTTPRHRLVTVGDSLTHGFKNYAISDTDHSWPAIVAYEMGWLKSFRRPTYPGPLGCPGLPLNLEALLRQLETASGGRPLLLASPGVLRKLSRTMTAVRDYWETGPGAHPPATGAFNHNLAIYGWDLRDALSKSVGWCRDRVREGARRPARTFLGNLFPTVAADQERAALRALAGSSDPDTTQLSAARALGDQGSVETGGKARDRSDGIETLIVALGANNALGTVIGLKIAWSKGRYQDLSVKRSFTIWQPSHFQAEWDLVVTELRKIRARHVILCSVPHLTILPLAHGIGDKPLYSRYFTRYTYIGTTDREFDGNVNQSLTGDEARTVDSVIDAYNKMIREAVKRARRDGRDWYYFDACGLLDSMAYRRYLEDSSSRPVWFEPYRFPDELSALSPFPDTRFLTSDSKGRLSGGLIGLDGVHPTTIGYGIVAQEMIRMMRKAGVVFYNAAGKRRRDEVKVHWQRLFEAEPLTLNPPSTLGEDLGLAGRAIELLDLRRLLSTSGSRAPSAARGPSPAAR